MSSNADQRWQWIQRSVEPTVEKWLNTRGSVVLMRGQRRSGKSSTVKHCARRLSKDAIIFYCVEDSAELARNARKSFNCNAIDTHGDIRDAIIKAIKNGKVVILEEIQNSSSAFQVSLQQTCDDMAFETMHNPAGWRKAGCLFMMGSLPGLVDAIFENRTNPLFQRISAKITVHRMNTLEISRLFQLNLKISDPMLQLSLYSIFGGKPHPYCVGFNVGLFKGNNTDIETIGKAYLSSELQQNINDASDFNCDYAFSVMRDQLYLRYGVIEHVYKVDTLSSFEIARFDLVEPLLKLATSIPQKSHQVRQEEDVTRDFAIPEEILREQEAFVWERWVVEIAQDRRHLCMEPCFPFLENNHMCTFCPKLMWFEDVEIDVVAGHPSTNTLIVGSCKRSSAQICQKELFGHVERLQAKTDAWENVLELLSLSQESLQVRYYHFVPEIRENDRDRLQKLQEDSKHVHVVDLQMLLCPFEKSLSEASIEPTENAVMSSSGTTSPSASTSGEMSPVACISSTATRPPHDLLQPANLHHSLSVGGEDEGNHKHKEEWSPTTYFSLGVASCAFAVWTVTWLLKQNKRNH